MVFNNLKPIIPRMAATGNAQKKDVRFIAYAHVS